MKKLFFVILTGLLLTFSLVSCKKSQDMTYSGGEGHYVNDVDVSKTGKFISEEAFNAFSKAKLDYGTMEAESADVAGKLDLGSKSASGGKSDSVGVEINGLDGYEVKYLKKGEVKIPEIKKSDVAGKDSSKSEPLSVIDWGPRVDALAAVGSHSFYVLFSEPMVSLAAIDQQANAADFMRIEPPVKGAFRWTTTSMLSYECAEELDPAVSYKVTVPQGVKSAGGKSLSSEFSFATKAEELKIKSISLQTHDGQICYNKDNVPPEYCHEILVRYNYKISAEKASQITEYYWDSDQRHKMTGVQKTDDSVLFTIAEDLPRDEYITIALNGKGDSDSSFNTLRPFYLKQSYRERSYGRFTNPVRAYFSQPIDAKSAVAAISSSLPDTISKDNVYVNGNSLTIYGLTVEFGQKYQIFINKGLKDIYGQSLSSNETVTITVPDAASEATFLDHGAAMLEAQFPHKLVFSHQNVLSPSQYSVQITDSPLDGYYETKVEGDVKTFSDTPKNKKAYETVDLDPYLNEDGFGWVRFDAVATVPRKPTSWDESTTAKYYNTQLVQVTDLGITVRYAINKIVVLVSKLSDGKAVKDAKVYVSNNESKTLSEFMSTSITGTTDSDGLAVINLTYEQANALFGESNYYSTPHIYVESGSDKAVFKSNSHSPWRSGIESVGSPSNALRAKDRILFFSDRGLYKPGETLSFRGFAFSQQAGKLYPFKEVSYTVSLTDDAWYDSKTFLSVNGATSENGGFSGSFTLPDDLEPGIYHLAFKRDGSSSEAVHARINVAFFERVKFQTALSMPKTPLVAGDSISSKLSATYLSGGSLSGADYSVSWFREPWYFAPDSPDLKNYTFGPRDLAENRTSVSQSEGRLDDSGNAVLSCKTEASPIKGAAYRYRASAAVTDASNQEIAAAGQVTVHPASFYLGIARKDSKGGFPKKGEKLSYDYLLALPEGKKVTNASKKTLASLAGDNGITAELLREEWSVSYQQGVYGDVYSRWNKSEISEDKKEFSLSDSGTFDFTPKQAGRYILRVSTKDKAGRDVLTEKSFYVTGSGASWWYRGEGGELTLTPDKNEYNPGETARVLLQSTLPKGDYLITVEREGIFTEEVRHFDESVNVIEVPIAKSFVPVVYLSISSYSVRSEKPSNNFGETDINKPKGYYGATTLLVNKRVKAFSVEVKASKPSYKPGEEAEVTLTATRNGKPVANAELCLMAVDRGVLDLINYHVPNPIAYFYDPDHYPLCADGGDSREMLMDPVTYEVKNLQGGDADADKLNERKDFNPTAVFEPMLRTDEKGQVSCKFKLPDTLTTYRVTAVGSKGDLFSIHEDEIAVQNPVNVLQVLPRRLRERDTAEMGVLINNLDGINHNMTVSLTFEDPENPEDSEDGMAVLPGRLSVNGKNSHTVKVAAGSSSTVYFAASAKAHGTVNAVFTIKSDVINERLVCPVVIEKPYIFETVTTIGQLNEKEKSEIEKFAIPSFAEDAQGSLSVTLDATRLGTLNEAVRYVFDYPYGCMEQQSSRILPLVIFEDYIDVFDMHNKVKKVRKVVKKSFKEWKKVQKDDGGFPYWPEGILSNDYVSVRIAMIAALAKARGYSDSEIAFNISSLRDYICREVVSDSRTGNYTRAEAAYVLAMLGDERGKSYLSSINETARSREDISTVAVCGLAYLAYGDKSSAKDCKDFIKKYLRPTTRGVDLTIPNSPGYWYCDTKTTPLALSMQLFVQLDKDDEMVTRLMHSLLTSQKAGFWQSTNTTAKVLQSVYTVIKESNVDATNLEAYARIDGKEFSSGKFKGAGAKPAEKTAEFTSAELKKLPVDTEIPLEFSKKGKGSLFYTLSMKYALPSELQTARDMGIGLSSGIYDNSTGEELKSDGGKITLESGKVYRMKVNLSSTRDRNYLALRAPVPSGAEILDSTFVTTASAEEGSFKKTDDWGYWGHWISSTAIYDNEIQFFWDDFEKGQTSVEFKFRAVRKGIYPLPPVLAECMYESENFGRTDGQLFVIK